MVVEEKLNALADSYKKTGHFLRQEYATTISIVEAGMTIEELYEAIVNHLAIIHADLGVSFAVQKISDNRCYVVIIPN